jgi:cyanophycin synthetase
VFLGYYSEQVAALALQLGYEVASLTYTSTPLAADTNMLLEAKIKQFHSLIEWQLNDVTRQVIRAARRRGIPYFQVVPGQRLWQYGHGKYSRHFLGTGSQRDSLTGQMLQHNKVVSNLFIRRLGFPGVEHSVADSVETAVRLATQIGYPIVIKPIDSRQGLGVTAGIATEEEIAAAFAAANAISPGRVVIERFVEGGNFRLAVYGGRLAYVNLRSPPRVVGTGKHTVTALMDIENKRRAEAAEAHVDAGVPKKLVVDADMLANLRRQKLRLNDVVPAGLMVSLRTVANLSTGGTSNIVTDDLHPDNREMAEAIARAFRLDTAGIDFLTPDIAKSWREVPCAVIEVNSEPQFAFPEPHARLLLERAFPAECNGRIPSAVLLVSAGALRTQAVLAILERQKIAVGFAERASAWIGGQQRFINQARLVDHVTGLLFDPTCEALVVACMQEDILRGGYPLDVSDLCIIDAQVKLMDSVLAVLAQCSRRLVTDTPIEAALAQWLDNVSTGQRMGNPQK